MAQNLHYNLVLTANRAGGLSLSCCSNSARSGSGLVTQRKRGSAIGIFYMLTGFAALIASTLTGWLWKEFGAAAALGFSAGMAALLTWRWR